MAFDGIAQEAGFCGHICPDRGPAHGYVCTRRPDEHGDLHEVVQLVGTDEMLGHVNAAWTDAGELVLFDPVAPACPLKGNTVSPQDLARIDQRVMFLSNVVDNFVDNYRNQRSEADSSLDVFKFNLNLAKAYAAAGDGDMDAAFRAVVELLAVSIRKLASDGSTAILDPFTGP